MGNIVFLYELIFGFIQHQDFLTCFTISMLLVRFCDSIFEPWAVEKSDLVKYSVKGRF